MELRHLRYFVAVSEELHFGLAAQRLHIVQPALSMQIKALEQELGVVLLRRDRRSVALTDAGRLFLAEARRTLAQAEHAVSVARRAASGALGRVRVGYSVSAVHSGVVGAVARRVHALQPQIEIAIDPIDPWSQLEALRKGDIDVAFGSTRMPVSDPQLTALPLARFPANVVLPQGHRLARRKQIDPSQLADEVFIEYAGSDQESIGIVDYFLQLRLHSGSRAGDPIAVLALVEAGQGISIMPSVMARNAVPGVVFRPLAGAPRTIDISMVWRRDVSEPALIEFLRIAALPDQ